MKKQKDKKILQFGLLASVITVLVIAAIFVLNLVAGKLEDKYGWQIDLTENSRYALSEETLNLIGSLSDDVTVYVMKSESALSSGSYYVVQAYQLFENYRRNSDKITVEYIDLSSQPTFASKFPEYSLSAWDIVVVCGQKTEKLSFSELYEYDSYSGSITASLVEQKITGAVMTVTSHVKVKVNVISGFSDALPEDMEEFLRSSGLEVTETALLTEDLSEDASLAILWAPSKDMDAASLKKLESWLDNNGHQGRTFMLFLDPNHSGLTNLEAFAAEWGILVRDGFAFEGNTNLYYQKPYYPIAQYADMTYASDMTSQDLTILALTRPLGTVFEKKDNFETDVLLTFTSTAGVLPPDAEKLTADMITGDVDGMVLSTRTLYGSEQTQSHVVVSGSSLAFSGEILTTDVFANGKYLTGLIGKLTGEEVSVSGIVAKSLTSPVHSMTDGQTNILVWVFMIILPLVTLAAGLIVYLKRRHK